MFATSLRRPQKLRLVEFAGECPAYALILNLMGNRCSELRRSDPNSTLDRKYIYKSKTASWGLHSHIERFHLWEYLELVHLENWTVFLTNVKVTLGVGYDLLMLLKVLKQPGVTIMKLPLPPRRTDNSQQNLQLDGGPQDQGLPPFSTAAFHQYLVKFITANDQVHIS